MVSQPHPAFPTGVPSTTQSCWYYRASNPEYGSFRPKGVSDLQLEGGRKPRLGPALKQSGLGRSPFPPKRNPFFKKFHEPDIGFISSNPECRERTSTFKACLPQTSEGTLSGNGALLTDLHKGQEEINLVSGLVLNPKTLIFVREEREVEMDTQNLRRPCKDRHKDQNNASTSQHHEPPRSQKGRKESSRGCWKRVPPTLGFRLLASRITRE